MKSGSVAVSVAETGSTKSLIEENIEALNQGLALIERLNDQNYSMRNPLLMLDGVGGHFRHCIEFYQNFLTGIESGRVDYDHRERDERLEKSRMFAADRIRQLIRNLNALPARERRKTLEVRLEAADGSLNDGSDSCWSASSLKRELQFLLSHTIHHYSLIALSLRLQGFEPGREFGVAPSTLKYWKRAA